MKNYIKFKLRNLLNETEFNYHKGDIENVENIRPYGSDNLFRMQGRGTGHFGSGLYFSTYSCENFDDSDNSKKELTKIKDNIYRVDFDIYKNLFRVKSPDHAEMLFKTLKLINESFYLVVRVYDSKFEMDNKFKIIYLKIINNAQYLGLNIPKYREYINMVKEAANDMKNKTNLASMSTRIMEYNGFNGVNVSGIDGYDNTLHGSVIYDLSKLSSNPVEVKNPELFCKIKRDVITNFPNMRSDALAGDKLSIDFFNKLKNNEKIIYIKNFEYYFEPYQLDELDENLKKVYYNSLPIKFKNGLLEKLPHYKMVKKMIDDGYIKLIYDENIKVNDVTILEDILEDFWKYDEKYQELILKNINRPLNDEEERLLNNVKEDDEYKQFFTENENKLNTSSEVRIKYDINLPKDIIDIKDIFVKNGYDLYLVGGSVRDVLLNKEPKDYDLATNAKPDDIENILQENGYKTIATGKAFGVINVITDSDEYEIATFRSEKYTDADKRRPDSVEFTDIYQDVLRRDITINALFYDIKNKEIVDLVGGIEDIKNGVIRTVGKPEDRFNEDKLRILRVLRFSARLDSDIDQQTDEALQKDASLEGISGERIKDEFIKGIKSAKNVSFFLSLIDRYNLFDWIFPKLNINKNFKNLTDDYIITISTLLKLNNPKNIGNKLNELRYTIDEIRNIQFLLSFLNISIDTAVALKKMQKNITLNDEQIKKFGQINNLDKKLVDAFIDFELSVNSQEVMDKFNLKPSQELGNKITSLETDNFKKTIK